MPDKDKHFADNAGILKKIKSVLGLNIGTMLFGALFLYMLFSVVLYLTSSNIESYLVIAGPLSRNETYTGLAIRTEKVYKAETGGYVSYYAREGSKINANGVVYGISSSQKTESSAELSSDDLSAIRSQMLSFSKGYNPSKFNNTYSFKYNLEGSILQYAGVSGTSSDSGVVSYGGRHSAKQNRMELFCIRQMDTKIKQRIPLRQKTLTRILIMKQILRHTMLFQLGTVFIRWFRMRTGA